MSLPLRKQYQRSGDNFPREVARHPLFSHAVPGPPVSLLGLTGGSQVWCCPKGAKGTGLALGRGYMELLNLQQRLLPVLCPRRRPPWEWGSKDRFQLQARAWGWGRRSRLGGVVGVIRKVSSRFLIQACPGRGFLPLPWKALFLGSRGVTTVSLGQGQKSAGIFSESSGNSLALKRLLKPAPLKLFAISTKVLCIVPTGLDHHCLC